MHARRREIWIVDDKSVEEVDDLGSRSIVADKVQPLRAAAGDGLRKTGLEVAKEFYSRAAEAVQRLIVVANNRKRCSRLSNYAEVDALLEQVCILILVDEHRANCIREPREPPCLEAVEECAFEKREVKTVGVQEVLHVCVIGLTKCRPGYLRSECAELLKVD